MKQGLLATAALWLAIATPAVSDEVTARSVPVISAFYESAVPEELGPIEVILIDRSMDSCWTNLREVREYAEEKLIGDGFEFAPRDSASVKFRIVVSAFRQEAAFGRGRCSGLVKLEFMARPSPELGLPMGNLVFAEFTVSITGARELNDEVVHFVGQFFEVRRELTE